MSQVIDLCEGSDDNGEWPNANTASVPSLPLSRKRPRDKELSNDIHPLNGNGPVNQTATGSAEFVADLEFANEVEVSVSPHKKRRAVVRKSKPSLKNGAAGNCAQNLEVVEVIEQDVGSEDSKQTSRDEDGSVKRHSRKLSTSKPSPNAPGQPWRVCAWEDRLSELADYRKIHGHCNVYEINSENTKLCSWVTAQRQQYKLHREGKGSSMTLSRVQELEGLGFEWNRLGVTWEDRLSELADYRRIHGHCNIPAHYRENTKLGTWVTNQRCQYRLYLKGKESHVTLSRIQELESLGFEWRVSNWEVRLSELADYRRIHGHCNVPYTPSKKTKLGNWVTAQRQQYKLHVEGKLSSMTLSRIQELEGLGFEWNRLGATWEDRLSELADYREIHGHSNVPHRYSENTQLARWVGRQRCQYAFYVKGKESSMTLSRIQELESMGFEWRVYYVHAAWEGRLSELASYHEIYGNCNVPHNYSENSKLATWVKTQRNQYRLHLEGKKSYMTLSRIQELERLGFKWNSSICRGKGKPNKSSLDDDVTRVCERAVEAPEHVQTTAQTQEFFSARDVGSNQVDVAFEPEESDWNGKVHLGYIPSRTEEI
jgi:predicted chitinase